MGLYSVFDVFEAKGIIHETGSRVFIHEGGYLRAFKVVYN